jgi:hypothetical protein
MTLTCLILKNQTLIIYEFQLSLAFAVECQMFEEYVKRKSV